MRAQLAALCLGTINSACGMLSDDPGTIEMPSPAVVSSVEVRCKGQMRTVLARPEVVEHAQLFQKFNSNWKSARPNLLPPPDIRVTFFQVDGAPFELHAGSGLSTLWAGDAYRTVSSHEQAALKALLRIC
jgi:hypothetical protein